MTAGHKSGSKWRREAPDSLITPLAHAEWLLACGLLVGALLACDDVRHTESQSDNRPEAGPPSSQPEPAADTMEARSEKKANAILAEQFARGKEVDR